MFNEVHNEMCKKRLIPVKVENCKQLVAKKHNPRTVLLVITIEMINNE